MHISERAIELPRLVLVGAVLICAVGFAALFALPKERTPRVKLPVIVITVPNPGATPDANERNIVRKLEEELATSIDGLRQDGGILSQSIHGAAVVQLVFDHSTDVKDARQQVQTVVNRVENQFPQQAQTDPGPIVNDIAFEDWPIIQVVVAGGDDGAKRKNIAKRLKATIQKINGVAGVDLFGGIEPEIGIEINPHLMVHYGLTYEQVHDAVKRSNRDAPTGQIDTHDGTSRHVRLRPKLADLEAIEQVPIGVFNGKPVTLNNIADVVMGHKKLTSIARYGGEDAVVLLVRARTDIDILATTQAVQQFVDQFEPDDPAISLGTVRSQAREIGYMIDQLGTSAIYGTILVIIILWVFLGWRNAGLISLSVPFAILGTCGFMWLAKLTVMPDLAINNMTLFALILIVGMVVDGCIIVGENIYRHRQLGATPVGAAKQGIRQVGPSLICAYMTTFAAFVPMFVVGGVTGDFLKILPVVVLFALCAALLVDHFLLPVLSVYFMKVPANKAQDTHLEPGPSQTTGLSTLEIQNTRDILTRSRAVQVYSRMIGYALQYRLRVLGLAFIVTLMPIGFYAMGAIGVEFFPDSDYAAIEVYYELPLGSSMEKKTSQVGHVIEQAVLRAVRPREWYQPSPDSDRLKPVTTIGQAGALNIRLDAEHGAGPEYGMVYVELELAGKRKRTLEQIRRAIADEIPDMPDVIVDLRTPKEGPPVVAPVIIRVLGRQNASLADLAQHAELVEHLLADIPGAYDVKSDFRLRPEFVVTPDRMQAALFDINADQISSAINFALEGVRAGVVDFGGEEQIHLRIQNQQAERDQFKDLANLPLLSNTGKRVILEQVAAVDRAQNANVIRHHDQHRVVNIRCQVQDGVLVQNVLDQFQDAYATAAITMSDNAPDIRIGGENNMRNEAMSDLMIALMIALAVMLIVLVLKFNSFIQPLIVLSSVPLSLVGVFLGLMIFGMNFSVAAMIGVVALAGIVVNDAIVLVDFINRLRQSGLALDKAVVYAGQMRLRPIFLTTVTTIGGLLPLALNITGGGEFWQPLTVTIMSGLAFATLLQLFIIPLACYSLDRRHRASIFDPMHHPELAGDTSDEMIAA